MKTRRFREALAHWLSEADTGFLFEKPDLLLSWTLANILLGEYPVPAREALERLRDRPLETKNPRRDVEDWASIAATSLLLDQPWRRAAEHCMERLDAGFASYGNDRRLLEPGMAVARLLGEPASAARWRELCLRERLVEEAESVGFEVLYQSSPAADDAPLSELATAVARVGSAVVMNPLFVSIAPHLMLLESRLSEGKSSLWVALGGQATHLDRLIFGETGAKPRIGWSNPRFHRNGATCSMTVDVSGSGLLSSGAHTLSPATELFAAIVLDLDDPAIVEVLSSASGHLVVTLRLDSGVEITAGNEAGFAGRSAVAWEHLRSRFPRYRCTQTLVVERLGRGVGGVEGTAAAD